MVDYEREEEHTTPEQPKRSKKGYFLSSLIGVIVGAVLMAFIMPYLSNEGLDTGALDQQQNNNGKGINQDGECQCQQCLHQDCQQCVARRCRCCEHPKIRYLGRERRGWERLRRHL